MTFNPEVTMVGLTKEQIVVIDGLSGDQRLKTIDGLKQEHGQAGHLLAMEHLEALDPRSRYYELNQQYQAILNDATKSLAEVNSLERQLKALLPLTYSRDFTV